VTDDQESDSLEPRSLHAIPTESASVKARRKSFTKLRRELDEEELKSPAIQRMLLDELDRLELETVDLLNYRDRFYEVDKKHAALQEKLKTSLALEIIYGVCNLAGAAALGYAPAVWTQQPSGYVALAFGTVLIVGGTVAKAVMR
jgi:hypothetical protein